jgi:hypothetical protein
MENIYKISELLTFIRLKQEVVLIGFMFLLQKVSFSFLTHFNLIQSNLIVKLENNRKSPYSKI